MSARANAAMRAGGCATQVGALCLREDGRVLLITSRGTHRWIIPKGWDMPDRSLAQAALQEAWEEAGVEGSVDENPVGTYHYSKTIKDRKVLEIEVQVYRVTVTELVDEFREAGQRKRRWFKPSKAARSVSEPELQRLLAALPDPQSAAGGTD